MILEIKRFYHYNKVLKTNIFLNKNFKFLKFITINLQNKKIIMRTEHKNIFLSMKNKNKSNLQSYPFKKKMINNFNLIILYHCKTKVNPIINFNFKDYKQNLKNFYKIYKNLDKVIEQNELA